MVKPYILVVDVCDLHAVFSPILSRCIEVGCVNNADSALFFDWCVKTALERILNVIVRNHPEGTHPFRFKWPSFLAASYFLVELNVVPSKCNLQSWPIAYYRHVAYVLEDYIRKVFFSLGVAFTPRTTVKVLVTSTTLIFASVDEPCQLATVQLDLSDQRSRWLTPDQLRSEEMPEDRIRKLEARYPSMPQSQYVVLVDIQDLYERIAPAIAHIVQLGIVDADDQETFFDWCVEEAVERFYGISIEPHMSLYRCVNAPASVYSFDDMASFTEWEHMYEEFIEHILRPYVEDRFGSLGLQINVWSTPAVKILVTYNTVFLAIPSPAWMNAVTRLPRRY